MPANCSQQSCKFINLNTLACDQHTFCQPFQFSCVSTLCLAIAYALWLIKAVSFSLCARNIVLDCHYFLHFIISNAVFPTANVSFQLMNWTHTVCNNTMHFIVHIFICAQKTVIIFLRNCLFVYQLSLYAIKLQAVVIQV